MQIFTARVCDGQIVPEDGVSLPEGTEVTVLVTKAAGEAFDVTPEEEVELLEAIAACERGETVTAAELFERLRR